MAGITFQRVVIRICIRYTVLSLITCMSTVWVLFVGTCTLQLAEKRKTLVDEMSIRGHESAEEQRKKMEEIQDKLRVSGGEQERGER